MRRCILTRKKNPFCKGSSEALTENEFPTAEKKKNPRNRSSNEKRREDVREKIPQLFLERGIPDDCRGGGLWGW